MSGRSCVSLAGTVLVLVVLGANPPDTSAQSTHPSRAGVLRSPHAPLLWDGTVGPDDAPSGGEPVECQTVPCDYFRLQVDLPAGTFGNPNRPGGTIRALPTRCSGDRTPRAHGLVARRCQRPTR
jgi:hypothetical protein